VTDEQTYGAGAHTAVYIHAGLCMRAR